MKNPHNHVFLGANHAENERRSWFVVALCLVVMMAEIVGGAIFGSIALIADGLHMATHVGALLLAALAYRIARRHLADPRFAFGTGKFGDLAGFASAVALAMMAVLIAWEALLRLAHPVAIDFGAAIPIAGLGLAVNLASAWLLGGHDHHHHHPHDHHAHDHHAHDHHGHDHHGHDGRAPGAAFADNNMRAAQAHVLADAAVSILVLIGLGGARLFGWAWLDPVMALIGAGVIVSWSVALIRASGAVLLDMTPDPEAAAAIRRTLEAEGARVLDLHVWRVGPGHLCAVVSIGGAEGASLDDYRRRLGTIAGLSHLTIEIEPA